ncbi:hypothetical protein ACFWBF_26800 [Streptomyces sp. NPDC060028]|uniref:hypothetical protein n=1 Tax=Streptomyces sp. NPDC060028 TaxID=3347041 RepID=UPI00367F3C8A
MNRTGQPTSRRGSGEPEDPWQHFQQVLRAMDRLLELSADSVGGGPETAVPYPAGNAGATASASADRSS